MTKNQVKFNWDNIKSLVWFIGIIFAIFFLFWTPLTESKEDISVIQTQLEKLVNNDLQHFDQRLTAIEQQQLKIIENQGRILGALGIKQ